MAKFLVAKLPTQYDAVTSESPFGKAHKPQGLSAGFRKHLASQPIRPSPMHQFLSISTGFIQSYRIVGE